MRQKEKLSRYDIEMLKGLMSKEVVLLRVFGYTSHTRQVVMDTNGYSGIRIEKGSKLFKRLQAIRKYADKFNFNDNKIVIQVETNARYDQSCLFLGYYDDNYSIGYSLLPSRWAPKEFPENDPFRPGMTVTFD